MGDSIREIPLARTVYGLAAKRFTGQLRAGANERAVVLGWDRGLVIAADSPFPADSLGRVALAAKVATEVQVKQALDRRAAGADLEAALAACAGLDDKTRLALSRRALAQRAARLFALEDGDLDAREGPAQLQRGEPPSGALAIDPRWLIARGVLTHYTEPRLRRELSPIADKRLKLAADAGANLKAFQLPAAYEPLIEVLGGAGGDIEAVIAKAGLEGRRALALLYVLVATDCLEFESQVAGAAPRAPATRVPARAARAQAPSRATDIDALITAKAAQVEAGADAFTLLGIDKSASDADVQSAYFGLAKRLHPDRLQAVGLAEKSDGQKVFAAINRAFSILSRPASRADHERELSRGDGAEGAADKAARVVAAENHVRRGEAALRQSRFEAAAREFEKALELNPEEGEHHALAGWAKWSTATDKEAVRAKVVQLFDKAAELSPKSAATHYYRGQVAKQTGDFDRAAACFRKVLELRPDHREAALELRLLESRAKRSTGGRLLSKLKRS